SLTAYNVCCNDTYILFEEKSFEFGSNIRPNGVVGTDMRVGDCVDERVELNWCRFYGDRLIHC
uniref:Uncharacterized protein n=1 Tax=Romanomermis culicivorax TaxID=13658 RepID=A0A915I148_ROMCU